MFDLIFKKKKSALTNETTEPEPVCKAPEPGRITILCAEESENSATFGHGEVHCMLSGGIDFIVGYYDFDSDGICHVLRESDKVEIAYISKGYTSSRFDLRLTTYPLYEWYKENNFATSYKKPYIKPIEFSAYGALLDEDTHQQVARYSGNPIEAIAAFAAMTYEMLNDSPYYQIYRDFFNS